MGLYFAQPADQCLLVAHLLVSLLQYPFNSYQKVLSSGRFLNTALTQI